MINLSAKFKDLSLSITSSPKGISKCLKLGDLNGLGSLKVICHRHNIAE